MKRHEPYPTRRKASPGHAAALGLVSAALLGACGQADGGQPRGAVADGALMVRTALTDGGALAGGSTALQGFAPRAVAAAIEEHAAECRAEGGQLIRGEGFDTRIALNGDDAPDHVIDYGAAECRGAGEDYVGAARGGRRDDGCGRLGCRVEVWLSGRNGHQLAFGSSVWGVQFVREARPARLRFSALGMPGCSAAAADGCHAEWGWNGASFTRLRWLTEEDMTAGDGATGLQDPMADGSEAYPPDGSGVSHPWPFRQGAYEPISADPDYTGSLSITASSITYSDSAIAESCRILSSRTDGPRVWMTLSCGECIRGDCGTVIPYDEHQDWTILAENPKTIRIDGIQLGYGEGRYAYAGP
ncbi:hypothetical protein [Brevundimonas lutea]|uniref:hypothetical protein n=1 Tax=Brevundimonas lutea TaxID=2293980 RepID=UPI0013CE930A|nr:hypothetical protein [Brevundimonas lutea]